MLGFIKPKLNSETITQKIVDAVVQDLLPLSFVQGSGFKSLIGYLAPNYSIPLLEISNLKTRSTSEFKKKYSFIVFYLNCLYK